MTMDESTSIDSRKTVIAGVGIVSLVTGLLFTNSPPAIPSAETTAIWSGSLSLLFLTIRNINHKLRVLDKRLYLLAREVSELTGSGRRRRAR